MDLLDSWKILLKISPNPGSVDSPKLSLLSTTNIEFADKNMVVGMITDSNEKAHLDEVKRHPAVRHPVSAG